jgi:hypothetical protein
MGGYGDWNKKLINFGENGKFLMAKQQKKFSTSNNMSTNGRDYTNVTNHVFEKYVLHNI